MLCKFTSALRSHERQHGQMQPANTGMTQQVTQLRGGRGADGAMVEGAGVRPGLSDTH